MSKLFCSTTNVGKQNNGVFNHFDANNDFEDTLYLLEIFEKKGDLVPEIFASIFRDCEKRYYIVQH